MGNTWENQPAQRIDPYEQLRRHLLSLKKHKPAKPKRHIRNFRKIMGSYSVYSCDFCKIAICTMEYKVKCYKCGREIFKIVVPT